MKVIALGTGTSQGIPLIGCTCPVCCSEDSDDKRLRSSIYVQSQAAAIVIDIGPDFRQQFITNKLTSIDAIFITHEHNDHIIGIDEVRAINFTQKKSIPIYASERVCQAIRQRFAYVFDSNPYPGAPQIELIPIDHNVLSFKDLTITPIDIKHGNLDIFGYRVNDLGYITDASEIPEKEMEKLKDLEVLVLNALRKEKHHAHFNLEAALEKIELLRPQSAYLTHISHNMGITKEWSSELPENVFSLVDNLTLEI